MNTTNFLSIFFKQNMLFIEFYFQVLICLSIQKGIDIVFMQTYKFI